MHKNSVVILGLGKSGFAAAKLAASAGNHVLVYDDKPKSELDSDVLEECETLGFSFVTLEEIHKCKEKTLIVASPGIPLSEKRFHFLEQQFSVISEIQFAWKYLKGPVIAVTGTNGKSTVVSLIAHLLNFSGTKAIACGNFGLPLSEVVSYADSENTVKVLELSSFQLERTEGIEPDVALCLEITEDHLDRHTSFEAYENWKLHLFRKNSSKAAWVLHETVLKRHPELRTHKKLCSVSGVHASGVVDWEVSNEGFFGEHKISVSLAETALHQTHNRENALFALSAISLLQKETLSLREGLLTFKGLPYRQQEIPGIGALRVINDSKATTPDCAFKAIQALSEPLILMLGGRNKGLSFEILCEELQKRKIKVVAFGEARNTLDILFRGKVSLRKAESVKDALDLAIQWVENERFLVFSPACASFDQFKNYTERGAFFTRCVEEKRHVSGSF
jgi:UDP-N-acetylmuramoylalanine--D-glutamate ligase